MSRKKRPGGHYDVGYGKPPKHTQFKKGQSGNRKGRPKGAVNTVNDHSLYALIDREASREVSVMNGDQKLTMNMANLVIRTLVQLAAKGNTRAIGMFMEHMRIIDEKGLAENAKLAKQREEDHETFMESLSQEQLEEYCQLLKRLNGMMQHPAPSTTQGRRVIRKKPAR